MLNHSPKDLYKIPMGSSPTGAPSREVCRSDALSRKNLWQSAKVVRAHDGAMAEECAVSSTTMFVDHSYGSGCMYVC